MRELLTSVAAGLIAGAFGFVAVSTRELLVFVYGSIAICALIITVRQDAITNLITRANRWFSRSVADHGKRSGDVAKYGVRPIAFADRQVARLSDRIGDPHVRAGVQLATAMLAVELAIFLVFIAIGVAITIVIFWAAFALLFGVMASGNDANNDADTYTKSEPSHPHASAGKSRTRQQWLGDSYDEIVNEKGDVVSTVHRKTSFLKGDHLEYRNADGEVIAEGRERQKWLGDRVLEIKSTDGEVIGESQRKEGFLGDKYIEHRDADGKTVSESRDVKPPFNDPYRDIREV